MRKELTNEEKLQKNRNKNRWIKIGVTMEQELGIKIPADDPDERLAFRDMLTELMNDGMFDHYIDYVRSLNNTSEKEEEE